MSREPFRYCLDMQFIKQFFTDLVAFVKNVAADPRIPDRDKAVLTALVALVISPIDLIPDWIPIFGMMDDAVIIALILDYFFNVLDTEILLSHFPWDMKSFLRVKRTAKMIAWITPGIIKNKIWKYQSTPY
jgi:uncharacterized membrane protein YkvA (DUF1232 family)